MTLRQFHQGMIAIENGGDIVGIPLINGNSRIFGFKQLFT